jgi:predicted DNA-binding transcriptional regulator AlpA
MTSEATKPIRPAGPAPTVEELRGHPEAGRQATLPGAVEPMLVPAKVAAPRCGRSEPSWWRDNAAGRVPAPVKVGRSTLWRVADLEEWVRQGCPSRKEFEARKRAKS